MPTELRTNFHRRTILKNTAWAVPVIAAAVALPAAAASTGEIKFRTAWFNGHGDVFFELTITPTYPIFLTQSNIHLEDSDSPIGISTVSPQTTPDTAHLYVVRMTRLIVGSATITITLPAYVSATATPLPIEFPPLEGKAPIG